MQETQVRSLGQGKSPGGGNCNPLSVFLPGESHGQKSLTGYSPWGCKESDGTQHASHAEREVFHKSVHLRTPLNSQK